MKNFLSETFFVHFQNLKSSFLQPNHDINHFRKYVLFALIMILCFRYTFVKIDKKDLPSELQC